MIQLFEDLKGHTITNIDGDIGSSEMIFTMSDGAQYKLWHERDCCETVQVEDICGDLSDLLGTPLTMAEEVGSGDDPDDYTDGYYDESHTWTFYKLATVKGYVTIRWLGESNGYYSEVVSFSLASPGCQRSRLEREA